MYSRFGFSDSEWLQLQHIISSNPNIERVILYGSRAKGNFKEFSDVDMTLTGSQLSRHDLLRLQASFHESSLPYTFDLSIFPKINNPQLIDHIKRLGVVIYERCER